MHLTHLTCRCSMSVFLCFLSPQYFGLMPSLLCFSHILFLHRQSPESIEQVAEDPCCCEDDTTPQNVTVTDHNYLSNNLLRHHIRAHTHSKATHVLLWTPSMPAIDGSCIGRCLRHPPSTHRTIAPPNLTRLLGKKVPECHGDRTSMS